MQTRTLSMSCFRLPYLRLDWSTLSSLGSGTGTSHVRWEVRPKSLFRAARPVTAEGAVRLPSSLACAQIALNDVVSQCQHTPECRTWRRRILWMRKQSHWKFPFVLVKINMLWASETTAMSSFLLLRSWAWRARCRSVSSSVSPSGKEMPSWCSVLHPSEARYCWSSSNLFFWATGDMSTFQLSSIISV